MNRIKNLYRRGRKEILRFIRDLKNYQLKEFIISVICLFKKKEKYDLTVKSPFSAHKKEDVIEAWRTDGIYNFGKVFSDEEIDAVIETLKDKLSFYSYNPSLGTFKKADAPESVNTANYMVNDYMAEDLFIKLLYDPVLLDMIQGFLGAKPVINDVSLYWSLLGRNTAKDAQIYHRDASDIKFLAMALYFTDVDSVDDGAYCYIKGSAKSNLLHKPKERHTDEEVLNTFGKENEVIGLGKKGTLIITDNRGYHRGKLPVNKERFIFFGHIGMMNLKKPLTKFQMVTDPEKKEKLKKHAHLTGNIAFSIK